MAIKSVVGLDIGASSVKGVQATLKGGEVHIEKVGYASLEPDLVVDGAITNPEILGRILSKMWQESKFTTKNVVTNISGGRTIARTGEFEWYRDDDFRKIFHQKLGDVFPVDLEGYYFDFHTLQEFAKREQDPNDAEKWVHNPKKFVLVVGAAKPAVDDVIKATQIAKLRPIAVDVDGLALLRAEDVDMSAENAADVNIDIGADTITIIIHKFGQPIYIRNIPSLGGRPITQEIEQEFQIPYERAEDRKIEALNAGNAPIMSTGDFDDSVFSFSQQEKEEMTEGEISPQLEKSREIISKHMSSIISSIRDTVETFLYNQTEVDLNTFSPFVLSGGVAVTPGLAERLASEFKNSVVLSTPLSAANSSSIPDELLQKEHEFAIAKGLAAGWVVENG